MDDKDFRKAAKQAYLSESEAKAILRIRAEDRLWKERSVDKDAMLLDHLALSHAVENHKRENAMRCNAVLKLLLDFLDEHRLLVTLITIAVGGLVTALTNLVLQLLG